MKNKEDVVSFLEGKNVSLSPSNPNYIDILTKWINDPIVRKYSRNVIPVSVDEVKKWFEYKEEKVKENIFFQVWHLYDKKLIGNAGLTRINWFARHANIFLVIGEKDYWNKNIGTEAAELLLKYGFTEVNLNKIYANIAINNIGSWSVAEKLGLNFEGISKHEFYVDGKYVDIKKYYILKEEWMEKSITGEKDER